MAEKRRIMLLRIISWVAIAVQICVAFLYADIYSCGAKQIKCATYVYEGGSFVFKSFYMSVIGIVCRLLHIHPLVFAHTALIMVIPVSYFAYKLLFVKLFDNNYEAVYCALLSLMLINIFGFWSESLEVVSLLTGYFTGYGLLIHVILPLAAIPLIKRVPVMTGKESCETVSRPETLSNDGEVDDDYLEEWDMKKHPIINARNLAIALGVLTVILLASVFVLNNKINTLYDATVNLQNQLNEYVDESEK